MQRMKGSTARTMNSSALSTATLRKRDFMRIRFEMSLLTQLVTQTATRDRLLVKVVIPAALHSSISLI